MARAVGSIEVGVAIVDPAQLKPEDTPHGKLSSVLVVGL